MAYSRGILDAYIDNDYKAVIMEWNNPKSMHANWENDLKYHPQKLKSLSGKSIDLIWSDSIAFQKFQRYAHNEYDLNKYLEFLKLNISKSEYRNFPIYSSDAEVFDYRPGRFNTESKVQKISEWQKIKELFLHLKKEEWCSLIFPSSVKKIKKSTNKNNNTLILECAEVPIPVKKQPKYNITRWALTGRSDCYINTKCYSIYNNLVDKKIEDNRDWKKLCHLWSSDYRTHIEDERWNILQDRLKSVRLKENNLNTDYDIEYDIEKYGQTIILENENIFIEIDVRKGTAIKKFIYKTGKKNVLFGLLEHGYYDHIAYSADFFKSFDNF